MEIERKKTLWKNHSVHSLPVVKIEPDRHLEVSTYGLKFKISVEGNEWIPPCPQSPKNEQGIVLFLRQLRFCQFLAEMEKASYNVPDIVFRLGHLRPFGISRVYCTPSREDVFLHR